MAVTFTQDKTTYTVDLKPSDTGLYRQNAMTIYEVVRPYMLVAKSLHHDGNISKDPSFYLVFCKTHGWVQVTPDVAKTILKHPLVRKFRVDTPVLLATASFVLATSYIFMKFKKSA